jgi:hypothetical protein
MAVIFNVIKKFLYQMNGICRDRDSLFDVRRDFLDEVLNEQDIVYLVTT